jgi:hypothetical protein
MVAIESPIELQGAYVGGFIIIEISGLTLVILATKEGQVSSHQ